MDGLDLSLLALQLSSQVPEVQAQAAAEVRLLLASGGPDFPNNSDDQIIEAMIESGIASIFLALLSYSDMPQLQLEATYVICDMILRGAKHNNLLVELGVIKQLIPLVDFCDVNIQCQALRGLGYLAADTAVFRDLLLQDGVLEKTVNVVSLTYNLEVLRQGTYLISKLCSGIPTPAWGLVSPSLTVLAGRLVYIADPVVLKHACWALASLTGMGYLHDVVETGVVVRVVSCLGHEDDEIQAGALSFVGVIATDSQQAQLLVQLRALEMLHLFLRTSKKQAVLQKSFTALTNIAASRGGGLQSLLAVDVFPTVAGLLAEPTTKPEVKLEAALLYGTAVRQATRVQLLQLTSLHSLAPLGQLWSSGQAQLGQLASQIFEALLSAGQAAAAYGGPNPYQATIEQVVYQNLERVETQDSPLLARVARLARLRHSRLMYVALALSCCPVVLPWFFLPESFPSLDQIPD